MKSIKSILLTLADQFDEWYINSSKNNDVLKASAETRGFAAAELRGAAAELTEDLYITPISPANIAEGAINLYIEYFNRWSDEYMLEDNDDLPRLEERAKAAAILDTLEGVEADVSFLGEKSISLPANEGMEQLFDAIEKADGRCLHCGKYQDRCEDCYPTAASLAF